MQPEIDAIKWAIRQYWRDKTDQEIADGINTDFATIKRLREEMGLRRLTMKEAAREYTRDIPENEKRKKLETLPFMEVWKMGEGTAPSSTDITSGGEAIKPIDITQYLLKVYGPKDGNGDIEMLGGSETSQLPAGSGR